MDAATFRANFPEFQDVTMWPDAAVNFWLTTGGLLLKPCIWDTLLDLGLSLFTAHHLVLEKAAQNEGDAGNLPGASKGIVAAASAAGVSVSYDTGNGLEPGAGHWNLTVYGTRFKSLVNMLGAKPLQL